jgi:restriction endonuclease S subunit
LVSSSHQSSVWNTKSLGDVADVCSGNGAPQDRKYFENGEYPFVRVQDLGRCGKNPDLTETVDFVNEMAIKEKRLKIFPKGTILFPKSGVSTLLNHRAILGRNACVVGHLAAVKANEEIVLTKWLYYFLFTVDFSNLVTATTLPSLPLSKIQKLQVPVPPIPTQSSLVNILEKADVIKMKRKRANQTANRILEAVFLNMFGDPYTNPMKWHTTNLGEVLIRDPDNGLFKKNEFYGSGTPIVWVDSLFDKHILDYEDLRLIKANEREIGKYQLKSGDILLCRSSLPIEGVGKMVVAEDVKNAILFESHVMRLRPNVNRILPQFIVAFYNSEMGRRIILEKARIATMTTINQPDVKSLRIFLPPLDLQHRFVDVLHSFYSLIQSQHRLSQKTTELFDSLISKAFSGELMA